MPELRNRARARDVLRSRLGRRLLLLFVACSLLPLCVFGWLALTQVTSQLVEESSRSLHANTKAAGMELAGRLSSMGNRLDFASSVLRRGEEGRRILEDRGVRTTLLARFRSFAVQRGDRVTAILGDAPRLVALDEAERRHLLAGKWLALVRHDGRTPSIQFVHSFPSDDGEPESWIVASCGPEQVFDPEVLRGRGTDIALLDPALRPVLSTGEVPDAKPLEAAMRREATSGTLEWSLDGEARLSRYWRVFLQPQFGRDWIVVQTVRRDTALASVQTFHSTFLAVAIVAVLLVTMVSLTRIRNVLGPVRRLVAATRRVRSGDFGARADLLGDDELAELGADFDRMTSELAENLSRRERTEKELVAARDAALDAARTKAQFLTNVSHELRTPLTSIVSAADILKTFGDEDPAAREEFLGILLDQSERLRGLIDGVLQLNEESDVPFAPLPLHSTIEAAIADFPPEVGKRIALDVPRESLLVCGDATRLQRLWHNLIDNAAKFSAPEQPIRVRATVLGSLCIVEVVDRGRGIPKEQLARVFEPFHQGDRDILTDKASGLGLGLTVAQDVVRRHGGRIEAQSEPGRGSTFRVVLPLAAEPALAAASS